jgi:hypothetical protein
MNIIKKSKERLNIILNNLYSSVLSVYYYRFQSKKDVLSLNVDKIFCKFNIPIHIVLDILEAKDCPTNINLEQLKKLKKEDSAKFTKLYQNTKINLTIIQIIKYIIMLYMRERFILNYNPIIFYLIEEIYILYQQKTSKLIINYLKVIDIMIRFAKQRALQFVSNIEAYKNKLDLKLDINFRITCSNEIIDTDSLIQTIEDAKIPIIIPTTTTTKKMETSTITQQPLESDKPPINPDNQSNKCNIDLYEKKLPTIYKKTIIIPTNNPQNKDIIGYYFMILISCALIAELITKDR